MAIKALIKSNTYFDSVSLMSLSTKANQLEGIEQAVIAMATAMNKGVLRNVGLLTPEIEAAGNGDLVIVVAAASAERCDSALPEIEALFKKREPARAGRETRYATFDSAVRQATAANLAIISVPGEHASREARKALDHGLHVLMFSDNVSLDDELALKQAAHAKGLLMMGPDCGTAILGHVGLCFANAVRPGNIGIVGASGTGSQEVSVRIHDFGGGITQLIGTGGRDLSERIGGIMMIDAMRALAADPATAVIVLVSKPPAKGVENKVLAEIRACNKPVVVCFLGGSEESVTRCGGHFARTTKEAALRAVVLAGRKEADINKRSLNLPLIDEVRAKLTPAQKHIRALLCGGTLCYELMLLAQQQFDNVYSNIAKDPAFLLDDIHVSREHSFIDLGDDDFTRGRPHPMIDPSLRIARLLQEAEDPSVGVIVLDFILGLGAHEDPVGVTLPAIEQCKALAAGAGRHLEILGYVLGTDADTPSLHEQTAKLAAAGVTIASSCTNAGLLARAFVDKGERA
ncbi:MAG: acyl-CoA synthetase FdrA [Pseudomonadota bacterium]|nr:acyl-CoA synthetase FdrA [Pseudomonadota bacterium]